MQKEGNPTNTFNMCKIISKLLFIKKFCNAGISSKPNTTKPFFLRILCETTPFLNYISIKVHLVGKQNAYVIYEKSPTARVKYRVHKANKSYI